MPQYGKNRVLPRAGLALALAFCFAAFSGCPCLGEGDRYYVIATAFTHGYTTDWELIIAEGTCGELRISGEDGPKLDTGPGNEAQWFGRSFAEGTTIALETTNPDGFLGVVIEIQRVEDRWAGRGEASHIPLMESTTWDPFGPQRVAVSF